MAKALTTASIEKMKPDPSKRLEVPEPALTGLYLVLQPSGMKSWAVRYRHHGKPRKMTLGKWPVLGVKAARIAATEALEAIEAGEDPGAHKVAERKAKRAGADRDSIEALVGAYASRHLSRLKSGATAKRELERHAIEAWRGRDVNTIARRDIMDLLDEILDSGQETTANRLRAYLGKFSTGASSAM